MSIIIEIHPSTNSRELRRNTAQRGSTAGCYLANNSHRRNNQRLMEKPMLAQFTTPMRQ
jgi:transposase, IS30 family